MKKLCFIVALLITIVQSNPIDGTLHYFNEIFLSDSSWIIELPTVNVSWNDSLITDLNDTIVMTTSTDTIIYPLKKAKFFENYCCIYSDSLAEYCSINPKGDVLSLNLKNTMYRMYLSLGDSSNVVPEIFPKSSLCVTSQDYISEHHYYNDFSPTLGMTNDTIDAYGNIIINLKDSLGYEVSGNCIGFGNVNGATRFSCLSGIHQFKFEIDGVKYQSECVQVYHDSTVYFDVVNPKKYVSGIDDNKILEHFNLSQNFPNPFNPSTTYTFEIPIKTYAELSIFDLQGKLIEKLVDEVMEPGQYHRIWNASKYPSGVYIYQLKTNAGTLQKKCIFIK